MKRNPLGQMVWRSSIAVSIMGWTSFFIHIASLGMSVLPVGVPNHAQRMTHKERKVGAGSAVAVVEVVAGEVAGGGVTRLC